jgi:hypothetical protein
MRLRSQDLFQTVRTEGALLPADLLRRVADNDGQLEGLKPFDYHLAAGERLNEAITRSWNRLLGAWRSFDDARAQLSAGDRGGRLTRERWLHVLFDELGYGRLVQQPAIEIEGKTFAVFTQWQHTPMHLVGCGVRIDTRTPGVAGAAGQSPHSLLQELLNRSPERLWGTVSNGLILRLLRDNVALTRQAYLDFDLEGMFTGEVYPDFVLLWLVVHQSRVEADRPEGCWLERWTRDAAQQGTRALDTLRDGVQDAIEILGAGFLAHPANRELHDDLRAGMLDSQEYYRQLLRLVYRLLFLFVAEDRDALLDPSADHIARARYSEHYSTQRLRNLSQRRRGGRQHDRYEQLKLVMEALHSEGCAPLGLPALGSYLWSPDAVGGLADAAIANENLLDAIRALATVEEHGVSRAVDFRNLGAEELGSIYESLLELHPELTRETASFALRTAAGSERKTTGSYYTPTSLITSLLDSALEPVLDEAAASDQPEAALLALTVCDPACGSGHFLIAAANRIAKRVGSIRTGDAEPSPVAVRSALRDIIGRCIYGVDVNPMAVELCKVSLWMEALDPGRPLSFLDDRIVGGNSLLGATAELIARGVPTDAFKPLLGDHKEVVVELRKRNARELKGQMALDLGVATAEADTRALAERSAAIAEVDDTSLRGVYERERRFRELAESPELGRARLLADTWCAAFVAPRRLGDPMITQDTLNRVARHGAEALSVEQRRLIEDLHTLYGFHHWHISFPGPWTRGGFDVVLGNPPWELVEMREREFFASSHPEVVEARTAAIRKRMISSLAESDPDCYQAYLTARRKVDGVTHLIRQTGLYPLTARGRINTYAIFVECMRSIRTARGAVGVVVKSGLVGDMTYSDFLRDCLSSHEIAAVWDFDNRDHVFPAVQGNVRFSLVTLRAGADRVEIRAKLRSVEEAGDAARVYSFSLTELSAINPDIVTLPLLSSSRDARLLADLHLESTRLAPGGWEGEPRTMINMATASKYFSERETLEERGYERDGLDFVRGADRLIPVYESKFIAQFEHRASTFEGIPRELRFRVHAGARSAPSTELADPDYTVTSRYWVPAELTHGSQASVRGWVLAFRDAISATADARSAIAAIVPRAACGDTLPVIETPDAEAAAILAAVINSFVFDYIVKQKISGGHLVIPALRQIALPPLALVLHDRWGTGAPLERWIVDRVLELTATAHDLAPWSRDLGRGGEVFIRDEARRELIRAELDAAFLHLYGVDRDAAQHILGSFGIVLRREQRLHGEFRTRRLILERYDAMAAATTSGAPYETVLDPVPADARVVTPAAVP